MNPGISIIIPVFREEAVITARIESLSALTFKNGLEVIVSDGDPGRGTLAVLKASGRPLPDLIPVRSPRGRGTQLNQGAAAAGADIFLFLHADTRIDQKHLDLIAAALPDPGVPACGAFDLAIDAPGPVFRIIERVSTLRSRLTRIPYGDQAIFMTRSLFDQVQGFPQTLIMEDVGMMKAIKNLGIKPRFLEHPVITSARRWDTEGIAFTTLRNWTLVTLYLCGVDPNRLARFYR